MPLTTVRLKNFTVFEDATFDRCPGVNVLIGANATGKTHAMKAMYAILRAIEKDLGSHFWTKFGEVFRPDLGDVRRLIRRGGDHPRALEIRLGPEHAWDAEIDVHESGGNTAVSKRAAEPSLYIPSREVLSMYEGYIAAHQKRELAFDETFFDLCVALNASPLRVKEGDQAAPILQQLETILGGKVVLEGDRFYVQPSTGERVEAHLVAEGLRKIAMVVRLVANGSIDAPHQHRRPRPRRRARLLHPRVRLHDRPPLRRGGGRAARGGCPRVPAS